MVSKRYEDSTKPPTGQLSHSERLLSAEELSEVLSVAVKTVRKWRHEGDIPAIKLGKRLVRYRLGDVLKWLNNRGGRS